MGDVILSSVGTATFILNLLVTVLLLVFTVHSGRRGLRRRHYFLVIVTLLSLTLAIRQAGLYGKSFDFNPLRLSIHLGFAFSALASFLGVATSGILLIKKPTWRTAHRRWVYSFIALVGCAVLTAIYMFLDATLIVE
jgi:hypothetical protein